MPDTETVEAPRGTEAEASPSFDTAQLDAILEKMRPMPKMEDAQAAPAAPAEATPEPPSEPAKAPEPPATPPEAPKSASPASPFDPPPSVLGEPPAEPEKAPATVEEEFGEIPEKPARGFKNKEDEANWSKMRSAHQKALEEVTRLRDEVKKKPPVDEGMKAQLEDALARNAQLNAVVERNALDQHPYVRQNFDEPRKQLFNIAAGALKKIDIDPAQLGRILSLDGKERVDAMDELYEKIESPYTRERVTNAIAEIDKIEEKRAEFMADRQVNMERLTQAEKAERYRQINAEAQQLEQLMSQTVDTVRDKFGFEFLRKATEPGSEKWNERVENDIALIRDLTITNKDPQKLVTATVLGVLAPHYREAWRSAVSRAKAAEARIAELEGATPSLNGHSPTEKASSEGTIAKSEDEMAAAGILPTDSLAVQARKLGDYWTKNGHG